MEGNNNLESARATASPESYALLLKIKNLLTKHVQILNDKLEQGFTIDHFRLCMEICREIITNMAAIRKLMEQTLAAALNGEDISNMISEIWPMFEVYEKKMNFILRVIDGLAEWDSSGASGDESENEKNEEGEEEMNLHTVWPDWSEDDTSSDDEASRIL